MATSDAGNGATAQPDVGQQAEGEGQGPGLGLYDLSTAPEELRPYLEQELKKYDGEVTKKFQEHADFRKQYEPLSGIEGLTDVPAEELTELMQFRELASDPDTFQQWWNEIGDRLGLFDDEDGMGGGDDLDDADGDEPPAWAQSLMEEVAGLKEQVNPLAEQATRGEQDRRVEAARQQIGADFAKLEKEHGEFDEDTRQAISQLALAYSQEEDAIARGFADYQRITGKSQGDLVDDKLGQPGPAMPGGQPDASQDDYQLDDPRLKAAAKARFAAAAR